MPNLRELWGWFWLKFLVWGIVGENTNNGLPAGLLVGTPTRDSSGIVGGDTNNRLLYYFCYYEDAAANEDHVILGGGALGGGQGFGNGCVGLPV